MTHSIVGTKIEPKIPFIARRDGDNVNEEYYIVIGREMNDYLCVIIGEKRGNYIGQQRNIDVLKITPILEPLTILRKI